MLVKSVVYTVPLCPNLIQQAKTPGLSLRRVILRKEKDFQDYCVLPCSCNAEKAMADSSSTPENVVIEDIIMVDDEQVPKEGEENNVRKVSVIQEEQQLEFIINVGIVKDCELSMPYWAELSNDKWNLFLRVSPFEDILLGYLKDEDVIEGIQVNVYDKGGHEFEMMLKKWVKGSSPYYVLNRGWFGFCNQHGLKENDLVAIRTFRHGITDKLSFAVTYKKVI